MQMFYPMYVNKYYDDFPFVLSIWASNNCMKPDFTRTLGYGDVFITDYKINPRDPAGAIAASIVLPLAAIWGIV